MKRAHFILITFQKDKFQRGHPILSTFLSHWKKSKSQKGHVSKRTHSKKSKVQNWHIQITAYSKKGPFYFDQIPKIFHSNRARSKKEHIQKRAHSKKGSFKKRAHSIKKSFHFDCISFWAHFFLTKVCQLFFYPTV